MIFSLFYSAVLLLHNQTRSICAILNEETWTKLHVDTCWPRDKIQDSREYLHDLFSSRSFHICAIKKPQDKWVDRTFPKPKEKFFVEIILSSKYLWKRNKFSIVIVNMWDSKWMTYPELSFDVTDGHGLKWCIKMDKLFVLIYLSPCFIKLGVVRLCIFCVVMQITWVVWKQTVPCIITMCILILEVCSFCVVLEKTML